MLAKPVDELITLLGLEVPTEPTVTLAGIRADGVILHWKPPEQKSVVDKYQIQVNGISGRPSSVHSNARGAAKIYYKVGEVSHHDTSVTVTGLKPEHFYIIRVVALNVVKFQAASAPIRLRTKPACSHDYFHPPGANNDPEHPVDDSTVPTVQVYKSFLETSPPPQVPPTITREHSGSISQLKRGAPGRRQSPIILGTDQPPNDDHDPVENEESVQQLTAKLDSLRRENEETEKAVADEDAEYEASKVALVNERDELQQSLKKRQDASAELRKDIAILSRDNTAAQGKKTTQIRLLEQKQSEKKKFKDDMSRWMSGIDKMRAEVDNMGKAKEDYRESMKQKLRELRQKHSSEQQVNRTLEESIRETGTQIKALEEEKRRLEDESDAEKSLGHAEVEEANEERQWQQRYAQLQAQYTTAWTDIQTAQASLALSQQYLDSLRQRRASESHPFPMSTVEGPPVRINSQRRRRAASIRNEAGSISGTSFPLGPPYHSSISSVSPGFSSASLFFNMNNGMTFPPTMQQTDLHHAEIEQLTGGAMMSPSHAVELLPSDLFDGVSGIADDRPRRNDDSSGDAASTSGVLPGLGAIPGLGAAQTLDQQAQGPSSPVSIQSHSPSAFTSPRESSSHLSLHHNADNIDSDRRSVRSTTSSLRAMSGSAMHGGTRFANIFSLHRQRGKTLSDDGPVLGSLKPSQSRSMPRNDQAEQDPIGTRRRRGSESGGLLERVSSAFSPNSGSSAKTSEVIVPASPEAGRKRWLFGSKTEPWSSLVGSDRASSPRPASTKTNSSENNAFPRPSTESQTRFGWPVDHPGQKHSPLTAEWGPVPATSSWSKHTSRRPSVGYGTSISLPHNEALFESDGQDLEPVGASPTQAPIGTRPQTYQVQPPSTPPKLNPAAKDFKSSSLNFFSRDRKGEKSAEKGRGKGKEKAPASEPSVSDPGHKEISPPTSRKSKDARSISTAAESIGDSRESLERPSSHTPSEALTPSAHGAGKESFMQRLTRKSSANKFNFPSFSKDKGGLFSSSRKASEIETPDETDEDVGAGQAGKGADGVGGSPQVGGVKENRVSGLSWSSIKKLGKKGDKAPSINESMTSETGDEEDEDEDEE